MFDGRARETTATHSSSEFSSNTTLNCPDDQLDSFQFVEIFTERNLNFCLFESLYRLPLPILSLSETEHHFETKRSKSGSPSRSERKLGLHSTEQVEKWGSRFSRRSQDIQKVSLSKAANLRAFSGCESASGGSMVIIVFLSENPKRSEPVELVIWVIWC
jgi:hypothetical protein